jgi:hypothetical protein
MQSRPHHHPVTTPSNPTIFRKGVNLVAESHRRVLELRAVLKMPQTGWSDPSQEHCEAVQDTSLTSTARTTPSHTDLPPSVEKAYYRKCIDLRRRINDIEENNAGTQLRLKRLNRAITKMRLERAFLLEQLAQRMEYNVDESDRSSSPPPTVCLNQKQPQQE